MTTQITSKPVSLVLTWAHDGFYSSFEDVDGEVGDLMAYFEQQLTLDSSFPKICSPELDMTQVHMSGWDGFLLNPHLNVALIILQLA